MTTTIRLQREPFDSAAEVAKLTGGRTDIGAVVTFTGVCRVDENGTKHGTFDFVIRQVTERENVTPESLAARV